MIEIERKFLVTSHDFKAEAYNKYSIKQGFLNSHKERTVRVRITDDKGFLTVKGQSTANGMSRFEWEKTIDLSEAEALLNLCEKGIIDKVRHEIRSGDHVFEVDVFFGDNEGLVIAEIELKSEDDKFYKPHWLGEEVTGDRRYYNSQLSKAPYNTW